MSRASFPLDGVRLQPRGGLSERALHALAAGPLSTAEVARTVLGITGGAGAAAQAVFALLGADPRFAVAADGTWSRADLAPAAEPAADAAAAPEADPVRLLREEEWAVVDLETTGAAPQHGHRVTEVAAVRVVNGEIAEAFESLVNPERGIPSFITSLTGISQEMVAGAPRFREVAGDVHRAVEGRVFVAHNCSFDWRFLSHEMMLATGLVMEGRQLCTVRLARRLLPELPSRSLDSLATYFGFHNEARHRALGDAMVTARVLLRLLDMAEERHDARDWAGLQRVLTKRTPRPKRRATPRSVEAA